MKAGNQARSDVALLYRRAGFGLTGAALARAAAGGYAAAVDGLLAGLGTAPDPGAATLPAPTFSAGPPVPHAGPGAIQARNRAIAADVAGLQQWWAERMVRTSTPLREKLALFWHGHFATAVSKVRDAGLMFRQNELFRTAGAGGFEALAQAVAKDGAMMIWLDTSSDKKAHPNENFAREMMERFTMGIGNYTQADVTAGAAGFTGWIYDRAHDAFRFVARQHDFGTKTYLGQTGNWNGDDIVRIAVTRPASARFVLARLWGHFAYPVEPSDPVVTDLMPAYGAGLSVHDALQAIFLHPAFRSATARTGLVKQPAEYLVGAARALGLDASLTPAPGSAAARAETGASGSAAPQRPASATRHGPAARRPGLASLASALGQTLFDPPNVGGWGQNAYWLDTATADIRLQVALLLAERGDLSPIAAVPAAKRVAALPDFLGIDGFGPTTTDALAQLAGSPVELVALALASPEYVLA